MTTVEELKQEFLAANETEKLAMMMSFAVQLTILLRGEYGPSGKPEKHNEMLHSIASQCLALIAQSNKRYPDDVFAEMLIGGAQYRHLTEILKRAFADAKAMLHRSH